MDERPEPGPHSTLDRCPMRKLSRPGENLTPAVECKVGATGERWIIRSFAVAREVLRDEESVRQGGFGAGAGADRKSRMRPPILYLEGQAHRSQRKATARYFAPKVTESYRAMMEQLSDQLLAELDTGKPVDLSRLALRMAVRVAAQVVGLTNSSTRGMSRRLETFFAGEPTSFSWTPASLLRFLRTRTAVLQFFWLDVKPAIRARRRQRRDDVISQLLDKDYSDLEILTECITYAAAGMVTTREFITMAAWHLLDEPDLLARFRTAGAVEREAILTEILRLEPVVGHLYRRTAAALALPFTGEGSSGNEAGKVDVPVGSLIDLDIRAINADAEAVGERPLQLWPDRGLPRTVGGAVMSFGDGNHKCPGSHIAMLESDIFLSRLLSHDLVAAGPPAVEWNDLIEGYQLRHFMISRADQG